LAKIVKSEASNSSARTATAPIAKCFNHSSKIDLQTLAQKLGRNHSAKAQVVGVRVKAAWHMLATYLQEFCHNQRACRFGNEA
jgi:hypothetical protein